MKIWCELPTPSGLGHRFKAILLIVILYCDAMLHACLLLAIWQLIATIFNSQPISSSRCFRLIFVQSCVPIMLPVTFDSKMNGPHRNFNQFHHRIFGFDHLKSNWIVTFIFCHLFMTNTDYLPAWTADWAYFISLNCTKTLLFFIMKDELLFFIYITTQWYYVFLLMGR